jgi:vancomycin resistance protein YoaR
MEIKKTTHKMVAFLCVITTIAVFSVLYFEERYSDKFYPGVFLDGEDVEGKTFPEVFSKYKKGADEITKNGITLIVESEEGEHSINIPMAVSGFSPDRVVEYFSFGEWEASIKEAYGYGRAGSWNKNIMEQMTAYSKNRVFSFPSVFQNEAIRSFYERELKGHLKEPAPSEFVYSGGKIIITKETKGEDVDFQEVAKEIDLRLSSFDPSPIKLKAKTINPVVTIDRLKPFLPVAEQISKGINISFNYRGYNWKINGRRLVSWLTLNKNDRLILDATKAESFLYKNILPVLDNPPKSSRFEMRDGFLVEIEAGKSGNMVDVGATISKLEEVIFGKQRSLGLADSMVAGLSSPLAMGSTDIIIENGYIVVPIEITEASPRVTKDTLDQYEIKELVGTATTNFKGSSADRIHNIKVGVEKLTGRLLAPGEEFSTVAGIGTTTEEEGFVKEYVIKGDKSVKELGGGLCQVATTLFRLALDVGLPITERYNHRYVVGYYGPGLDATIYDPHPDLRFINDTGKYLLLQGTVKDSELIFDFFGQDDGRQVNIGEPVLTNEKPAPETKYLMSEEVPYATMQCSETPRKGVTAEVLYTVEYKDGRRNEQKFKSIYQPWRKICLIGTGGEIPLVK